MSTLFQNPLERIGIYEQINDSFYKCLDRSELIDEKTVEIIKCLKAILDNSSEEDQREICKTINKKFPRLIERIEEISGIEESVKTFRESLSLVDDKKSEIETLLSNDGIVDSKLTDELIELCKDVEIENERIASLYIQCYEECQFINNNYEAIKVFLAKIRDDI